MEKKGSEGPSPHPHATSESRGCRHRGSGLLLCHVAFSEWSFKYFFFSDRKENTEDYIENDTTGKQLPKDFQIETHSSVCACYWGIKKLEWQV